MDSIEKKARDYVYWKGEKTQFFYKEEILKQLKKYWGVRTLSIFEQRDLMKIIRDCLEYNV